MEKHGADRPAHFPIAIVGMGCRMPGGVTTLEEFWDVLVKGRDMVTEIPPDRWSINNFYHKNQSMHSKMVTKRCGFIKDIDKFDNSFFQISPREAASMDPQQRHMLEVTYEAFQDAGIIPSACEDSCGVYIAVGRMDYPMMIMDTSITNPYTLTGIAHSVVANRISYVFDFKGPSMVVDTACASSFTAVHLACTALWNGECTLAVAGGANPVIMPEVTVGYSALGVLSPEGMSCPFSDTAKGYVRSEGWGALILKPLDAALRDEDHIYAVIPGSAIASNGASKSLTMPCTETQKMVMRMAYDRFDIPMASVQYVEAHGTGTPVGDPIEAKAIGETFGRLNKFPIRVGSVKSNFGHTECSSGVTSAIKVALMLENKQLVPTINFNKLNPSIALEELNILVQTQNEPIETKGGEPYRVGLNSFGFAGAVAHIILEESPEEIIRASPTARWKFGEEQDITGKYTIVPLSAKSPEALKDIAEKWQTFNNSDIDALHIAAWQATRREHHPIRLAIVAESSKNFRKEISNFLQDDSKITAGDAAGHTRPKVCFVFPGQGQQWFRMGRQLYEDQPIFRQTIDDCDSIFRRLSGWSLLDKTGIFKGANITETVSADVIEEIEVLQPSIHFLQIGLFQLWKHWGVYPDAVVGHSLGEVAAAYAANAVSLDEAISVVYHRSLQQATLTGTGGMAALRTTIETTDSIRKGHQDVYIAAINGPGSVTLSGDYDQISAIVDNNIGKARQLRVSAAFHTPYMNPIETKFRQSMEGVFQKETNRPELPFYSAVTGKRYKDELGVDYWWQNIRRPILFQSAIEGVLQDTDINIFLEVAATATLRSDIQKIAHLIDPSRNINVITTGRRNANDQQYALIALGHMYTSGVDVNWNEITNNAAHWAPGIPTYQWQHQQSLWIEADDRRDIRLGLDDRSFKGKHGILSVDTFPFLSEYYEDDILVFPATGFIEYATETVFDNKSIALESLSWYKPLLWHSDSSLRYSALELQLERDGNQIEVEVQGTTYFRARMADIDHDHDRKFIAKDDVLRKCNTILTKDDLYYKLQVMGITNGPSLQIAGKMHIGDGESLVSLSSNGFDSKQHAFISRLNVACHAPLLTVQQPTIRYRLLSVDSVRLKTPSFVDEEDLLVYSNIIDCDGRCLIADVLVVSESGSIICQINKLTYRNIENDTTTFDLQRCLYITQWQSSSAKNLPTSVVTEAFSTVICEQDMDAIQRAETVADDIEDICMSYIKHAMETVPERERAKTKRYHKSMAIFDAITSRHKRAITPFDEIPRVMANILTSCPELEVEMRLTKRLGEALPDTLRHPRSAVPIMFSSDCLDRYFWDGLSMRVYYVATAEAVVRSVREALKTKQVVRVLELGARIGGLTRFIVKQLAEYGLANRLEYVFTDVSATFFGQARKNLSEYPFIQYQLLSVEKGVTEQGFIAGSYDIVICLDTLHVAVDARRSTRFMSDLLADEGVMYLLEGTNTHYLTELWFGFMDVCLVFDDERTDVGNKSCWFHREGWLTVMRDVGLEDVVSVSTPNEFYHSIMVGRKPAVAKVEETIMGIRSDKRQSRTVFVLEEGETDHDMKCTANDDKILNGHRGETKTLGEELTRIKKSGEVNIKHFTDNQQLVTLFNEIKNPVEMFYTHSEQDNELRALLKLLQMVELFPRKVSRLWIVVRSQNKLVTSNGASALGLAQSFGNRIASVAVQTLRVAMSCSWSRVAHYIITSTRDHAQSIEHHLYPSHDSSEVVRIKHHGLSNSPKRVCKHWQVRYSKSPELSHGMYGKEAASSKLAIYNVRQMDVPAGYVNIRIQSIPINSKEGHCLVQGVDTTTSTPDVLLGIQCSGIVEDIYHCNSQELPFKVGQEVAAFGEMNLGSHVVCDSKFVIPKKRDDTRYYGLTSLVSAYYTLHKRAKLQSYETILIHMSDDPVCLAAIEVAKCIGCKIICAFTVKGHAAERNMYGKISVEKLINISSSSYKDSVLKWTGGKGVDVVLSSSSKHTIHDIQKILSVMAPDGRLCDTSRGRSLQMTSGSSSSLMGNKIFHSCQIDLLLKHQPDEFRSLMHEVVQLTEERQLIVPFSECKLTDVLQGTVEHLQRPGFNLAEQVVLQIPAHFDPSEILPVSDQFLLNATYIITDGYGSLAQTLARWLCKNGAKSIALTSFADPESSSATQTIKYLRRNGVEVQQYTVNLGSESEVNEVLQRIRTTSNCPIKGIFHLDTVIKDENPFDIKANDVSKVIASTVARARNLHELTKQDSLDIFLTLSSMSTLCGFPGKPVSAATNAFVDALAEHRHKENLPALSIQVGPMRCMGSVIGVPEAELLHMPYSTRKRLLHTDDFLEALGELLRHPDIPVICLGDPDWGVLTQSCPNSAMKFRHLAQANVSQEKPRSATMNRRQIEYGIKSKMAELLGMRIDAIDGKRPMTAYGVDSLVAMEIANWANDPHNLGLVISQFDILDGMTIATLLNKAVSV